jgi:membrane fusion protein (multidrug efflux system)
MDPMSDANAAEAAQPVAADSVEKTKDERMATRTTWLKRLAIGVAVLGLLCAAYWFFFSRNVVTTDNAYVNAEVAQVTPLTSASVLSVHVRDTQPVKRGTVLVELDPANARIAFAQAQADLAEAQRRFRQTLATSTSLSAQVGARGADINAARAQLGAAQAEVAKARTDLARRESIAGSGAVSGEELTAARRAYAAAQANLAAAQAGIAQAQATRQSAAGQLEANNALVRGSTIDTDPGVLAAQAKLEAAQLELNRMTIRAPIDGVVSQRKVQVGQRVAQGSPIMTIVPLNQVYIEANFKESQLRKVRIGMPVEVVADLYGSDVVYHGRVAGISGGTGASQSILPAQNATGNWIKVVQRVPVRIELDPRELAAHPLRIGLSTEAKIDVSGN